MADEESSVAIYLTDISQEDKSWDKHRGMADGVKRLYSNTEFAKYSERIAFCSTLLGFALQPTDEHALRLKLNSASFCRVRLCAVCQWRRSLMWRGRFFKAIPNIHAAHPAARWLFLTLTVRNCEVTELRRLLSEMNEAWNRLSMRRTFPAIGWIKATEVTRSKDGSAHPHFHILLLVESTYFGKNYVKHEQWTEWWKQSLRVEYTPIVDIKAVKSKKGRNTTTNKPKDEMIDAICETLKYSVKPDDLVADQEWLLELTKQLHKTRAIALGGVVRNFMRADEPEDLVTENPEELELQPEDVIWWFGWREMVKRYMKISRD